MVRLFSLPPPSADEQRVLLLIALGLAFRIALAAAIGLGVDESYEVVVSRSLSWSYLDHPPLSFWIPGILARVTGSENRVLLRLPFILMFAATTWLMFQLTTRLYGARAGFYAALLLNVAPVFGLTTGSAILPDGPLNCALLLATLALVNVLLHECTRPWRWWLIAGVAAGVALLSKYHAVFLLLGALAFVITQREARAWLARPEPYVAASVVIVLFLPVIWWNAHHDFASFAFQSSRARPTDGRPLAALVQNLGGQAAYLFPWIWIPLLHQLFLGLRSGPRDARRWLLTCLAVGPIAVFTLDALGGNAGLPHWPAPGYLLLFPLLGAWVADRELRNELSARSVRRALVAATGIFVGLTLFAASIVHAGWLSHAFPPLFPRGDPSLEAYDWTDVRSGLAERGLLRAATLVAATHWIDAAKIGYALGPDVRVICLSDDQRHFRYASPAESFVGRDLLLLVRLYPHRPPPLVRAGYARYFDSISYVDALPITRAGHFEFAVGVYRASRLRLP